MEVTTHLGDFLNDLAAGFPLGIVAWDEHQIIRYCNPNAASIFKQHAHALSGLPLTRLLNGTDKDNASVFLNQLSAVSDTHKPLLFHGIDQQQEPLITGWRLMKVDPGTNPDNLTIALVEDLTENQLLIESAQFSNESYKQLSAQLNDFIYTHDLEGNFTNINKNGAAMLGYSAEEFLGLNVIDLVDPEHLPRVQKMMRDKIQGDTDNTQYQVLTRKRDGEKVWLELSTRIIHVNGKIAGIQGIARNVTPQKVSEAEREQSEQKFKSIFDTIDDIYYHLNNESHFDLVSPSAYTHLGYHPDELLGRSVESLYADPEQRDQVMAKLLEHGHINDYEINLRHKNNTIVPFSVSARILLDKRGAPRGIEGIARNITQRKEHERIQKSNEQRFRRIFESIQDVYFRVEDSIVKFVSPSCKHMLGYAPEEMIGHSAEEFYIDPDARLKMLEQFQEKQFLSDYEIDYRHQDGHPVTCSLNLNAIRNNEGEIVALEGTLRDITTRKQAEKALRGSEQRFRRIFESFQDTYYEADKDGLVTMLSPAVEELYGYKPSELIGKPATDVYADPSQRDGLVAALQQHGVVNDYELMLVHKNGELKPTSCTTRLAFDEDGQYIGVQGVLRDITERKKAEAELRNSEMRFRSIFNSIPDAFLEINSFDTIVNASPSLQQFGYNPEELMGTNIATLFNDKNEWKDIHGQLQAADGVTDFESALLAWDRRIVPVSVTAYKIVDPNNASHNAVCIIRDISQSKRYEKELELARDQALEASRAKSTFLANMSHELRTPLNAIIGYSEMLIEEADEHGNEQTIDDLRKIHQSGTHLLSIISDILDLSKIEAGKIELYPERIDIAEMVNETIVTISPMANKNNNRLHYQINDDIEFINADKIRLKQALYNLLSNACKFTQSGQISLNVYKQEQQGGVFCCFAIQDSGIGINEAQMQKLFNEFTQVDSTTTRKYEGTGLGLVISKRFCQLMGGNITATSEYGQGSCFTISLPADD